MTAHQTTATTPPTGEGNRSIPASDRRSASEPSASGSRPAAGRFGSLEGLRGALSLWVFGTHIVAIGGYPWSGFTYPWTMLVHGGNAVDVFIILSGFVIAKLLVTDGQESYPIFVLSRFLRLYPAYILCLTGAFALTRLGYMEAQFHESEVPALWLSHLVMLHGVFPESVLHNAAGAFLTPA